MNDVAISFLIFLSSMLPVRLELYLWVERDEPLRNDVARRHEWDLGKEKEKEKG